MQIQFNLDPNLNSYTIRAYKPGRIKINDDLYHQSLIIAAEQLVTDWGPQSFSTLNQDHIEKICDLNPDIVLLGTGVHQHFLSPELMHSFLSKNIGLECMTTLAACRTYNVLMSEGRNAVAALLIA